MTSWEEISREPLGRKGQVLLIALVLVLAAVAYSSLPRNDFLHYDDQTVVTDNALVKSGLTWQGLKAALGPSSLHLITPVTTLSHMLDCQLYGLNPTGHHLTGLLLHLANTTLLFFWLLGLTGRTWRSWAVAALFAVHPMNVEAVAWLAERKGLLCVLFALLALMGYGAYVRSGGARRYALVGLLFLLSLLCKPSMVILPCIFLLLDLWPLGRLQLPPVGSGRAEWAKASRDAGRMILEKVPFLALSLALSATTFLLNLSSGTVTKVQNFTFPERLANGVHAYGEYLSKLFVPVGLSLFYPHPGLGGGLGAGAVALSGLLLVLITGAVLWKVRSAPYLAVGWFWFLGALVPNIGLVEVGSLLAYADRYAYFSFIGLFVALVWGLSDLLEARPQAVPAARWTFGALLLVLAVLSYRQVGFFRNTEVAFRRSLLVSGPNNYLALTILAMERLREGGDPEASKALLKESLRQVPGFWLSWENLGVILLRQGRFAEARKCYEEAGAVGGAEQANVQTGWGKACLELGDFGGAIRHSREAVRLSQDYLLPRLSLIDACFIFGDRAAAESELGGAMRLWPRSEWLLNRAAVLAWRDGRTGEALRFEAMAKEAVGPNPRLQLGVLFDLEQLLTRAKDLPPSALDRAVILGDALVAATGRRSPEALALRSAAYARAGRAPEAPAPGGQEPAPGVTGAPPATVGGGSK
jgi:protein O-mannosyl-transferase